MPVPFPLILALLGAHTLPSACTLMTKTEAQAHLAGPIVRVVPEEPAPDEDTGSIHTSCTFMGRGVALVIAVDEFPSAAAAKKTMTAEYMKAHNGGDEDAPPLMVEPESGLGDQGFYGHSEHAAMMVMVKGTRAYAAVFGGPPPKPTDRATLHKLVTMLAAKS